MSEIKVGDKSEMAWPFYVYEHGSLSSYGYGIDSYWASGCAVWYERYDQFAGERFFSCNAEGKIIYEVLAVVKLTARYQDRIIVRVTKINPDGEIHGKAHVRTLTKKMYLKHINSHTPFNHDYDVDEDLCYEEIQKIKNKREVF